MPDELYSEHVFSNRPIGANEIWENCLGITVKKEDDDTRKYPTVEQQKCY